MFEIRTIIYNHWIYHIQPYPSPSLTLHSLPCLAANPPHRRELMCAAPDAVLHCRCTPTPSRVTPALPRPAPRAAPAVCRSITAAYASPPLPLPVGRRAPRPATRRRAPAVPALMPEKIVEVQHFQNIVQHFQCIDPTFLNCWFNIFELLVQHFFCKMLNKPLAGP